MKADEYYEPSDGPLNQGDILVAPVSRVSTRDYFVPDRWDRLDEEEHHVDRSGVDDDDIHVVSGRALVMVTSHDCHHDKEWNAARGRLIKEGYSETDAEAIAGADETLDRMFQGSPLIPLEDFPENERGNYRAGRVVGYFPVPASPDGAFPESVVDLTYRCTIDKQAMTGRAWCLSQSARDQLRYSIARFDSFRTVELTDTIEEAVGKTITDVTIDDPTALAVTLTFGDGSQIRLVRQPAEPVGSGRPGI